MIEPEKQPISGIAPSGLRVNDAVVRSMTLPGDPMLNDPRLAEDDDIKIYRTLRFGKLTMRDTDLLLVDKDPKDAFDFSPERYNAQLVAGYSKNTPAHGLIVYMPDLVDLDRGSKPPARAAGTPDASRTRP